MNAQENLIDQLEGVLASKDLSKRADILRRVTDLFIHGSGSFSDDQIELFDDVMGTLAEQATLTDATPRATPVMKATWAGA